MEYWDLYDYILGNEYIKSGDDVDWNISIFESEKKIRLIFAPSNSKRDWINNFTFPIKIYKKQENKFYVASGWGNAWKSCNDEIMSTLEKAVFTHIDYSVEIDGYSYGGAMALLAAEDFNYRMKFKADVITFGAPKPLFGKKTQKYFESCCNSVKQFAHVNDCVTLCPPLIGYTRIRTDKLGDNFCLIELFHPDKWHQIYGKKELYI